MTSHSRIQRNMHRIFSLQAVPEMMTSNDFMLIHLSFVRAEAECCFNYKGWDSLLTWLVLPAEPCHKTVGPYVKAFWSCLQSLIISCHKEQWCSFPLDVTWTLLDEVLIPPSEGQRAARTPEENHFSDRHRENWFLWLQESWSHDQFSDYLTFFKASSTGEILRKRRECRPCHYKMFLSQMCELKATSTTDQWAHFHV